MIQLPLVHRRHFLAGTAALAAACPLAAHAEPVLDAASLGVLGDTGGDQTEPLQAALDQAAASGQSLRLPAGVIMVQGLSLPGNLLIEGVPGRTWLTGAAGGTGVLVQDKSSLSLRDVGFAGGASGLSITGSDAITLERCGFRKGELGINISDASVTVRDCHFADLGDAAIHAMNSRGLVIANNSIDSCGNAGIRIWRAENGDDGSIVSGNRIARIDWRGGGNGQNGNGINIFWADGVIVADNHLSDCAFSAIRLNSTNNSVVSGNICLHSGEVAIFSEFAFSGSVIASNIVDGAAQGISITNLDSGGQLAVCSGNIVRNITPRSAVNPDTVPVGIFAEAQTAITGNTVQNVPGIAIAAGYGSFLQNVLISGNVVSASITGIGVSVVEGAGPVHIGGNTITGAKNAVAGLAWDEMVEPDLVANGARYPNVSFD
ncbi:MAG: TIGR03808 family TAT-translocated repetitive protein [Devosia sp.]